MNGVKLNIRALAALMNVSIEKLAEMCEISPSHLKQVSCGRLKMSAYDLSQLAKVTGISVENIKID